MAFEAVGFAETFRQAISITRTGGTVTAVGNLQKETEFNLQELVSRELTFTGSYASAGEFRTCIDLIASGKMNVGAARQRSVAAAGRAPPRSSGCWRGKRIC